MTFFRGEQGDAFFHRPILGVAAAPSRKRRKRLDVLTNLDYTFHRKVI
jgi:hypothetical protein